MVILAQLSLVVSRDAEKSRTVSSWHPWFMVLSWDGAKVPELVPTLIVLLLIGYCFAQENALAT